jgi:hypothetical protein
MLAEHKDNEVMAGYISDLTKIKKEFNSLNISFDVTFDPHTAKDQKYLENSIKQIETFRKPVINFRNKLIK